MCDILEAQGLGARKLDLDCERVDGRGKILRIGTARPNRDPKRLTPLLCDRLDRVDPGFGIKAMSLSKPLAEPLQPHTAPLSLAGDAPTPYVEGLIDVPYNRLGGSRVYGMAPVESDVPERSVRRWPPPLRPAVAAGPQAGRGRRGSSTLPNPWTPWPHCRTSRRPPSPGAASGGA